MEELGRRFPLISQIILNNVDDYSLANFRKASRENTSFLDSERFYWIRNIKKYSANFEEFQDSWKKIINRTSVEFLKELAIDVHSFFKGLSRPSKRYEGQWHPLLIGAERGSLPLCEHIVKRIGDVNPKCNGDGCTPLHTAAIHGHLEICKLLIDNVDDKSPTLYSGWTPLDKTPYLYNGWTPLHLAAQEGHLEVCKLLMESLDNKNPGSNNGTTPLHQAAIKGHLDVYKQIIQYLDVINPRNNFGWTPLHVASYFGCLELCEFISKNTDDPNPLTSNGKSPIYFANESNHRAVVSLLRLAQIKN